MAILILHSPRSGTPEYDTWLADLDDELYLFCSTDHLPVDGRYAEAREFESYEVNGAVEAAAWDLFDEVGYRAIVARAECDLLRAARLRDRLGLPGQSWTSAIAYRDKTVMKSCLQGAGIATPAFRRLDDTIDLLAFVRQVGYPLIVKPVDGSGSLGIHLLSDRRDLEGFVGEGLPAGYEAEELVEGQLCHVDGLVLGGEIVVSQPSRYVPPDGPLVARRRDAPYGSHFLDPASPLAHRLNRFAERVVGALPSPPDLTFHAEMFHTPADELVFCEIASRTGGVGIGEALRRGLDVNLDELWVKALCGLAVDAAAVRARVAAHIRLVGRVVAPPHRGTLVALPDTAPSWMASYRPRVAPGATFTGAAYEDRKTGDFVASCVVAGESEAEVERRVRDAVEWLEESIVWEPAPPAPSSSGGT